MIKPWNARRRGRMTKYNPYKESGRETHRQSSEVGMARRQPYVADLILERILSLQVKRGLS